MRLIVSDHRLDRDAVVGDQLRITTPERTNTPGRRLLAHSGVFLCIRRRPSLPHGSPCSTIGAERLNFRVRNGAGCFPLAMITETLWSYRGVRSIDRSFPTVTRELHSGRVASL